MLQGQTSDQALAGNSLVFWSFFKDTEGSELLGNNLGQARPQNFDDAWLETSAVLESLHKVALQLCKDVGQGFGSFRLSLVLSLF